MTLVLTMVDVLEIVNRKIENISHGLLSDAFLSSVSINGAHDTYLKSRYEEKDLNALQLWLNVI